MNKDELRICADCKWGFWSNYRIHCHHSKSSQYRDRVTGAWPACSTMRVRHWLDEVDKMEYPEKCGGDWWEEDVGRASLR